MAIFKCKMCGGTLEINNETVAVCQYCGTKQTLPKLDDDRKANLYDRANHFRRNNEFDKAMGIYEQILNEDNTDAESYWSLVLCRYGIEYVEDPSSRKRIPTINRSQFTSVFDDEDYKSAIKYADDQQKELYENEATVINEIHKRILTISSQEEPFDVFICYKESDTDGRRTPDSVLATELYHELVREGFKVFFSRITLEDKLGQEYEPYIFAALNSAKVMVVLGTKPEYFNAVWVKNEWSRYLALIKNGARKMLIPAYKDMDPYDLPEEFSHLQAQDMSKLGFMQDLIRGIKKISSATEVSHIKPKTKTDNTNNISAILDRAFIHLETKEWTKANRLFEEALKINAHLPEAYLGKCMVDLRITDNSMLAKKGKAILKNKNYKLALKFEKEPQKSDLQNIINKIQSDIRQKKQKNIKRFITILIVLVCLSVFSALTYFVGIPYGKYLWYKNQLSNENIKVATSSYKNSIWFEYDNKVKKLFYDKGVILVENQDFAGAEFCFAVTGKFKNTSLYYNYCKAHNLLAKNDLESYDYFVKCDDFLDSNNILETNEYFILVNKLQGEWYYPGETNSEYLKRYRESGEYYEINGNFYSKSYYSSYGELLELVKEKEKKQSVAIVPGMVISGPMKSRTIRIEGSKGLKILENEGLCCEEYLKQDIKVEFIDDTHIKLGNRQYKKIGF